MADTYNASEIVGFAVKIEEEGMRFYKSKAETAESSEVRESFSSLMQDEGRHRKMFEDLLQHIQKAPNTSSSQDQFDRYMKTVVDQTVFKKSENTVSLTSEAEVLDFAIDKEMDSILFYTEMANYVADKEAQKIVDRIIEEERHHVIKLQSMRDHLG